MLQIEGSESCNPTCTMYYRRLPAEFADSLNHTSDKEYCAFVVDFGLFHGFNLAGRVTQEVVIVIDEIYLKPGGLQGGHLNYKWMVGVVDYDVHTRQTDDFMELVAAFVDSTVTWHECAHFGAAFLYALGQGAAEGRHLAGGEVGFYLLRDV